PANMPTGCVFHPRCPHVMATCRAQTPGPDQVGPEHIANCHLLRSSDARATDVVMIGPTHFTNAVVQRRALAQTAAIRLGLPATASLPPMVDWPDDLKAAIGGHYYMAHGG